MCERILIMNSLKKIINYRLLLYLIIVVNSVVPVIIWPFGKDYFYYPKILLIYILIIIGTLVTLMLYRKEIITLKFSKDLVPLVLFIIMVILSTSFSQYKSQAFWGRPLRHEGCAAFISYFLITYFTFLCINSMDDIKTIIKSMMFSASVISIYGVCQYLGFDMIQRDDIRKSWTFTSFATLGNPNFLGSYLSLLFPGCICLYLNSSKKISKCTSFILCLLLYSALICTKTRSAWVGTAFSLLVLCILFFKKIIKYKYNIIILLISFVALTYSLNAAHNGVIAAKFNSLITDYNSVVNKKQYSSNLGSQRLFIWNRAMDYIFDRPLLGSGPDTFDKVFKMSTQEALYHFGAPNVYVDKAHNEYLQIAVTMGFPALVFYLLFLLFLLSKSFSLIITKKYNIYSIFLFSGVIAYAVQGFFNISVVSVAPVYWSMLGMIVSINNRL